MRTQFSNLIHFRNLLLLSTHQFYRRYLQESPTAWTVMYSWSSWRCSQEPHRSLFCIANGEVSNMSPACSGSHEGDRNRHLKWRCSSSTFCLYSLFVGSISTTTKLNIVHSGTYKYTFHCSIIWLRWVILNRIFEIITWNKTTVCLHISMTFVGRSFSRTHFQLYSNRELIIDSLILICEYKCETNVIRSFQIIVFESRKKGILLLHSQKNE